MVDECRDVNMPSFRVRYRTTTRTQATQTDEVAVVGLCGRATTNASERCHALAVQ